jgi:sortase A
MPTSEPTGETAPSLTDNPLVMPEDTATETDEAPPVVAVEASPITRIVAESIGLDTPVVAVGWTTITRENDAPLNVWTVADYAAGWHKNSALPGQGGNIVLSGHHNIKGEVFRYTIELNVGDIVTLYEGDQAFKYAVVDKFIVKDKDEPEVVRRENAKWISSFNEERLTLVTCWPYTNNTHRAIVIAKPVQQ